MMEGWQEYKFSEVAQFPPKIKMKKGESFPFIPMENLDGSTKFAKPLVEKQLKGGGSKFEEGDTLFSRITPCLQNGKIAQAKDLNNKSGFGSTEYFVFRGKKGVSDSDFIYYLSKTYWFRQNAVNSMVGASGRQRADAGFVRNLKVKIPPLPTQRKIASILSAYDDLIENNLKRIKLLEEKAQLTYEEWFVRMKFPGHEKVKEDEETGLPEGWEKVNLNDLAEMKFGFAFKASQFNSEGKGTPIIRIRNIPSSSTSDYTTEKVDEKYIVRKGDLLIGMDGEFYVNTWTGEDAYLVQRVCNLVVKDNYYRGLLTEAIKHPIMIFQASIDGATVAHLGKKHLDQIQIVIPDEKIKLEIFNDILKEKINLSVQNRFLKEARDILLPRLMSGKVDPDDIVGTGVDDISEKSVENHKKEIYK